MPRPSGPTPPPTPKTLAPPPRRRTSSPGNGASASTGARRAAPPRPAPPRQPAVPPTPRPTGRRRPHHARRRSIALALLLTVVILAGYGAYLAYDELTGSDNTPAVVSTTGYEASVERAISAGEWSIILGLGFHNLKDSYVVRDQFNAEIQNIRNERANLETLLPNVLGPRSDTVRASIESLGELETAIAQWRDALFLLRFGNVDAAQDAIESANAQLTQQLETWKGQEGT